MLKDRRTRMIWIASVLAAAALSFAVSAFIFVGWDIFHPKSIPFDTTKVNELEIKKYIKVRDLLKNNFYEPVDENKMLEGAIAGMAGALGDRYTAYYTQEQWKRLEEDIEGSYVGIGITIDVDSEGFLIAAEMYEGSPAKAAGMKTGDKIVKVNGEDVTGLKSDVVIGKIKGKEGSKVKITVYRPSEGKTLDLEVTRKKIKVENISSKLLAGQIGYIKISKFDAEIARYFEEHLEGLLKKNMKGLIIDVRDNPGGYYEQVVAIADRLLPKGIIVYTEDRLKTRAYQYSDNTQLGLPLAILINGGSASASEILAGAVKDNKMGKLVGTKTYGKGLVQTSVTFKDGSGLKFTIQRYFTPSGVCIQGTGILPDLEVEPLERYAKMLVSQVPESEDIQLKAAIEAVKSQMKQ